MALCIFVGWHSHQVWCAPASPAGGGGDLLADVLIILCVRLSDTLLRKLLLV